MNADKVTRTYRSPLRAEQAEQTRERILETVVDLMAEGATLDLPQVAARAQVSVRTIYRHFPTREDLIDTFNGWMVHRFNRPAPPTSLEDLPALATDLFRSFAKDERLLRAAANSPSARDFRTRRWRARADATWPLFEPLTATLPRATVVATAATIQNLISSDSYLRMRDVYDLSPEAAAESVSRTITLLLDDLQRRTDTAR